MRKILLVEDDPVLLETYKIILSTQPYICDHAENGKIALEMYRNKKYDLVLLDIMMPVMDGIEFLENINNSDEIGSRVVIMSNLSGGKEVERVKELGVNKTILKSDTSPRQLISLIRYHLDQ
jgi:DNA-binding response OmpR family regulator